MPPLSPPVQIDVWSDYVCPFCYLELPVIEQLQAELDPPLAVSWRAFELRPEPVPMLDPGSQFLRTIWQRSVAPMAAERGLAMRMPPVFPRSRLAHVLARYASGLGGDRSDRVHRQLFRAYFEDGRDIGDRDVLLDVAASAGIDRDTASAALDDPALVRGVVADERLAADLMLEGVPALVLHRTGEPLHEGRLVSGAQPIELLRRAVHVVATGDYPEAHFAMRRRLPLNES